MNPRVINVQAVQNYKLLITFANGEKKSLTSNHIWKKVFLKS
jgi:hypothetical protein